MQEPLTVLSSSPSTQHQWTHTLEFHTTFPHTRFLTHVHSHTFTSLSRTHTLCHSLRRSPVNLIPLHKTSIPPRKTNTITPGRGWNWIGNGMRPCAWRSSPQHPERYPKKDMKFVAWPSIFSMVAAPCSSNTKERTSDTAFFWREQANRTIYAHWRTKTPLPEWPGPVHFQKK